MSRTPIEGLPQMFPGGNRIGAEEEAAVLEVVRSKRLFRYCGAAEGPSTVAAFERDVARQPGVTHAIAVAPGTTAPALTTALAAVGVGPPAREQARDLRPAAQHDQGDGGIAGLVMVAAQPDALAASGIGDQLQDACPIGAAGGDDVVESAKLELGDDGIDAEALYDREVADLHVAPHWRHILERRTWSSRGPWSDQADEFTCGPCRVPCMSTSIATL